MIALPASGTQLSSSGWTGEHGSLHNLSPRSPLDFRLPAGLEAGEPPEARGLARDEVRLMVSHFCTDEVLHTRFREIPGFLQPGDLLVINTSGTMNAALPAERCLEAAGRLGYELHLSTRLPGGMWVVELRRSTAAGPEPFFEAAAGEELSLPAGGRAVLFTPYTPPAGDPPEPDRVRLWVAGLHLPLPLQDYLNRYGFPIRYKYVRDHWPLETYQTVYADQPGSAEMPSAGRAFTPEIITRLVAKGVQIAPLVLHTGVASLEEHEPPYEEYYRVPPETARQVNAAHIAGKRVVAVGTTSVRALETVTGPDRVTHPGEGWTDLVITPRRGLYAIDGLLTGLHEPRSSHLALLETLAGRCHLQHTYTEALQEKYLWHEFGDLHLLLP